MSVIFVLLQKATEITEELQKLLGCDLLFHYNNFRLFCLFRNASVIKISRGGRCLLYLFYYRNFLFFKSFTEFFRVHSPSNIVRVEYASGLHIKVVEVIEKSEVKTGKGEIVADLCLVYVKQFTHGFEFDDNLVVTDKVSYVVSLQQSAFVM